MVSARILLLLPALTMGTPPPSSAMTIRVQVCGMIGAIDIPIGPRDDPKRKKPAIGACHAALCERRCGSGAPSSSR